VEVAEIQSLERLDLGAQRLLVIRGGGDQIVEVDVLDVKSLAHVDAAGIQELRHLGAVAHRVELGLHRFRPGGNLAEGKCRGEDLDKDRVHPADGRTAAPKVRSWRTISVNTNNHLRRRFPTR
jgi:hypothetical protein